MKPPRAGTAYDPDDYLAREHTSMTTVLPRVRLKTKDGKTVVEPLKPRMDASKRRRVEAQAARAAKAWKEKRRCNP